MLINVSLGFLTTFALIGREHFVSASSAMAFGCQLTNGGSQTPQQMAMNLTKIFYGSSYVGFDMMTDIDPLLGPPLMFIFVTLSSILLMGSLTGEFLHDLDEDVPALFSHL